ncbi:protein required for actin cytoskeleton organization and cell cycle progression [Pluteus cervinus]|uniref:Protein required for actin cytoskeleton organization and cell cycle progression n=1 Tax=Pluteus cervinus TaxID=181527 RepID=A0ACD3A028_9AGAR|nr:protein required for actin cytoskeleton organization and cell cycle progression [Pluteus cervinus]
MGGRGVLLAANLPQLQNLIKRDPQAYKEEFLQQWNHFKSVYQIFQTNPSEQPDHFRELIAFLSQVATCYPTETAEFPSCLSALLLNNYGTLSPETRKALIQNVVLLRNKNVISSVDLLKILFPLLPRAASSSLQSTIRKTILTDIRTANLHTKNHKLNRAVQAMLFSMVEQGMDAPVVGDKGKAKAMNNMIAASASSSDVVRKVGEEAMWAVIVCKELWKKQIWTDAKTVSIIALGCFHPVTKVQSASAHFFLGSEDDNDQPSDEEEEVDVRALHHRREINKKKRSSDKKLQKALNKAKTKKYNKPEPTPNFPALEYIHDPQTFSEKLFLLLTTHDRLYSLAHKILLIQLLSRLLSAHKLCVLPFYTYILPFLSYRQLQIPSILASLAQSVHELTPPDVLEPVIRKLAGEFVNPGVASEVISAGLNSITQICRRQPWAMEEDLLGDLVEYRKSKDKLVIQAARGLLQLYREVNPGMLKKKERGKEGSTKPPKVLPYGHRPSAATGIEGLKLLEDHLAANNTNTGDADSDSEEAWKKWEVGSDSDSSESSDASAGWIDVSSDSEGGGEGVDIEMSDSDDEGEKKEDKERGEDETMEDATEDRPSILATTKILTPADFALLNSLRLKAAKEEAESIGTSRAKRKLAQLEASMKYRHNTTDGGETSFLSEHDILGPQKNKRSKSSHGGDEDLKSTGSIAGGSTITTGKDASKEKKEKYGPHRGGRGHVNKEPGSSTTNREKKRNKPLMMILGSGAVRSKKKASLREKQQRLQGKGKGKGKGKR